MEDNRGIVEISGGQRIPHPVSVIPPQDPLEMIKSAMEMMWARMGDIEQRLQLIDQRFNTFEERFQNVEKRIGQLESGARTQERTYPQPAYDIHAAPGPIFGQAQAPPPVPFFGQAQAPTPVPFFGQGHTSPLQPSSFVIGGPTPPQRPFEQHPIQFGSRPQSVSGGLVPTPQQQQQDVCIASYAVHITNKGF